MKISLNIYFTIVQPKYNFNLSLYSHLKWDKSAMILISNLLLISLDDFVNASEDTL